MFVTATDLADWREAGPGPDGTRPCARRRRRSHPPLRGASSCGRPPTATGCGLAVRLTAAELKVASPLAGLWPAFDWQERERPSTCTGSPSSAPICAASTSSTTSSGYPPRKDSILRTRASRWCAATIFTGNLVRKGALDG
ncbi:MAG: hypothetical protein R2939_08585 [Kofleriaceae bacterium]